VELKLVYYQEHLESFYLSNQFLEKLTYQASLLGSSLLGLGMQNLNPIEPNLTGSQKMKKKLTFM